MHTLDRLQDQLAVANTPLIPAKHAPDIRYAAEDAAAILSAHTLAPNEYVCLIPGGSAHRPEKRWPHFATLAERLTQAGYTPVLIGGKDESALLEEIEKKTKAVNLCGKTNLNQLIDVLQKSATVIGNDTGPTHLAAAAQTPTIVLFGAASDPSLCAPRGENVTVLQEPELKNLSPEKVFDIFCKKIVTPS